MTKVKFLIHTDRDGNDDLIAYFPEEKADRDGGNMCYAHVGQHSACSPAYAKESREATKEEYQSLLDELESVGYNDLLILNKNKQKMRILKVCAKTVDRFCATLIVDGKYVANHDGYVPDFMPGEHYGDYVELDIDIDTGMILNWEVPTKAQLKSDLNNEGDE